MVAWAQRMITALGMAALATASPDRLNNKAITNSLGNGPIPNAGVAGGAAGGAAGGVAGGVAGGAAGSGVANTGLAGVGSGSAANSLRPAAGALQSATPAIGGAIPVTTTRAVLAPATTALAGATTRPGALTSVRPTTTGSPTLRSGDTGSTLNSSKNAADKTLGVSVIGLCAAAGAAVFASFAMA
ncbi:hypothetical protein XA68_13062 [Ophiocordyceps unilateralis]|uniref:Uncharacterized protein n=1 Tax=Ophiocordyceps unilateralis TaxID=268505 RepID=A0A2A9PDD7_OPHUN|nr:hypothetical protein XA68_13062 [Ophiocordyceps unilateralis]